MSKQNALKERKEAAKPKILVCVDHKDHSRIALKFACLRGKRAGRPVTMLHVIDPSDYAELFSVGRMKEELRAEAAKLLEKMSSEAREFTSILPQLLIREGRVVDQIIAVTEEDHDIQLVILGAQDKASSKSGILATATSEIGRKLQVPLMIVPGNLTDQQIEALA